MIASRNKDASVFAMGGVGGKLSPTGEKGRSKRPGTRAQGTYGSDLVGST